MSDLEDVGWPAGGGAGLHWHFQLRPAGEEWRVRVRRTTYWALSRDRLTGLAAAAGFTDRGRRMPRETGFFQPLLVARAGPSSGLAV